MNSVIEQQVAELGIEAYLDQHHNKSLLRFLTCGSVDDGKSTLIGRLLHDSHQIYEDQLAAIHTDSQKVGTTGDKPDLALLVDGLQAEREQGITIDVAYRYFSTKARKFIIADTPGHEQYTRNMATGASTCDVAVILIDARKGVLDQTRRHSYIASLLGIRQFIVAINKMDLVDFDQARFDDISQQYLQFSKKLNPNINIQLLPLSALEGDNVVSQSTKMSWYQGEPLLTLLEYVDLSTDDDSADLRFPVQYVNRPNLDFRGFAGTLASGELRVGQRVAALPSGKTSTVERIVTFDGDLASATKGQAITVTLADEIDISRGDTLIAAEDNVPLSNNVLADIVWMGETALTAGRQYDIKVAGKKTLGSVSTIRHQVDINSLDTFATETLPLNGIGLCEFNLHDAIAVDSYQTCKDTGGFIIIDRLTNVTVGAGLIREPLATDKSSRSYSTFEVEFNALVRKHFPHWDAKDISQLLE
ncbi:sulfate adenylyltransferase [Photobacterium iliopiscarium]|uniref:Sulfate adenylyltransferase subunit 1 n=1 Tax=Photobacterium iliopiscarium TaxID=56192 RepID=A0ABX5GLZ6_9GAMM|nr:sulfate adenylyltransferase subunit CysN [Photobacterium iliopiscarium]KJG19242.1 sulfate adenylyltransferase [Photobacterium iliopiscarium]PSW89915.1 sulfate adenylyltransferase subunit CysN [Photobacterium iliopiscarium]